MNVVVLKGTLSRARRAPGAAVRRRTSWPTRSPPAPTRARPRPCPSPGPTPAEAVARPAGDEVVVTGRVQRRFFRAGGATQSRTEVVAERGGAGDGPPQGPQPLVERGARPGSRR